MKGMALLLLAATWGCSSDVFTAAETIPDAGSDVDVGDPTDAHPSSDGQGTPDGGMADEASSGDTGTSGDSGACVPSGSRAPFNTQGLTTASGCASDNACANSSYPGTSGMSFEVANQYLTCSGSPSCVENVGVTTAFFSGGGCGGSWDVYCNGALVGNLNTIGKTCEGDPMTNGCSVSFAPRMCSAIKFVAQATAPVPKCCLFSSTSVDSLMGAVSAW
ncbi:MAG: hypothetical protein ACYDH4_10170 [Candidatus Cryosericum sp.]